MESTRSAPQPVEERRPHIVIKPSSGWQALNLAEIWQFRDLLFTLASRDVKLRYRQTALGAVWVILQPLLAAGIFSFVFGRVAKLPSNGVPYFVFSYSGLLAWNAFANTLGRSSTCLVGSAHLVSKVYFPRLILPLSTVFSAVIDALVAFAVMVILLIVNGIWAGPQMLLLPVWGLLILLLALGIGLFASALMVSYRDVGYVLPVVTQFLLYASPVAYAVSAVPQHLRSFYFLNPLSGLLEAFRWSLIGKTELPVPYVAYSAVFSVTVFVLSAFAFKKMEKRFADII